MTQSNPSIFGRRTLSNLQSSTALRTVVGAAVLSMQLMSVAHATDLPTGGSFAAGAGSISDNGTVMDIIHGGNAVIDWSTFDIATGKQVNIDNGGNTTVNRVVTNDASEIFGTLWSNGKVWLINPNGIMFGAGSVVDVNGLVATTANTSLSAGDIRSALDANAAINFDIASNPAASIINNGSITVGNAGLAALVAPSVVNNGMIVANMGKVQLAGADTFTIDMFGDGLINLDLNTDGHMLVDNQGSIVAKGGQVLMTTAAANSIVNALVNNDGVVDVDSVGTNDAGEIILYAAGSRGKTTVGGTLSAEGLSSAQSEGGEITVGGNQVFVKPTARLEANGRAGGGDVQIGGQLNGTGYNTLSNYVTYDTGAKTFANATENGQGGHVSLNSFGKTIFNGSIEAKGAGSNAGGDAEISSVNYIEFQKDSKVNLNGGVAGSAGTLKLDPTRVGVANAIGNVGAGESFVSTAALSNTLTNGTNVEISAHDRIRMYGNLAVANGANRGDLAFKSGRLIEFIDNSSIATGGGDFTAQTNVALADDSLYNYRLKMVTPPPYFNNEGSNIVMRTGSSIDAGTGDVTLEILDNSDKLGSLGFQNVDGFINAQAIKGDTVRLINHSDGRIVRQYEDGSKIVANKLLLDAHQAIGHTYAEVPVIFNRADRLKVEAKEMAVMVRGSNRLPSNPIDVAIDVVNGDVRIGTVDGISGVTAQNGKIDIDVKNGSMNVTKAIKQVGSQQLANGGIDLKASNNFRSNADIDSRGVLNITAGNNIVSTHGHIEAINEANFTAGGNIDMTETTVYEVDPSPSYITMVYPVVVPLIIGGDLNVNAGKGIKAHNQNGVDTLSAGNINLNAADGEVEFHSIYATEDFNVTATRGINNSSVDGGFSFQPHLGFVEVGGNLNFFNGGKNAVESNINLNNMQVGGSVEIVNEVGSIQTSIATVGGHMTLNASQDVQTGPTAVFGNLDIDAGRDVIMNGSNVGTLTSANVGGNANINAGRDVRVSDELNVGNDLLVDAGRYITLSGGTAVGRDLYVKAVNGVYISNGLNVTRNADISAYTFTLAPFTVTTGDVEIQDDAFVGGELSLGGKNVTLAKNSPTATLTVGGTATIDATETLSIGRMNSGSHTWISARDLNAEDITTGDFLVAFTRGPAGASIDKVKVNNTGMFIFGNGDVTLGDVDVTGDAMLEAHSGNIIGTNSFKVSGHADLAAFSGTVVLNNVDVGSAHLNTTAAQFNGDSFVGGQGNQAGADAVTITLPVFGDENTFVLRNSGNTFCMGQSGLCPVVPEPQPLSIDIQGILNGLEDELAGDVEPLDPASAAFRDSQSGFNGDVRDVYGEPYSLGLFVPDLSQISVAAGTDGQGNTQTGDTQFDEQQNGNFMEDFWSFYYPNVFGNTAGNEEDEDQTPSA